MRSTGIPFLDIWPLEGIRQIVAFDKLDRISPRSGGAKVVRRKANGRRSVTRRVALAATVGNGAELATLSREHLVDVDQLEHAIRTPPIASLPHASISPLPNRIVATGNQRISPPRNSFSILSLSISRSPPRPRAHTAFSKHQMIHNYSRDPNRENSIETFFHLQHEIKLRFIAYSEHGFVFHLPV